MRVFLTGATGFIGSALVPELVRAGHHVVGLTRSGGETLARAGAEPFRGDVNDLDRLRAGAAGADAVIHTAFNHDYANQRGSSEDDRKVILALGEVPDRPLVIASGTGLARSRTGEPARESDDHVTSAEFPRAATEEAADALIASGSHVVVVRLPQVHDTHHFGRVSVHVDLARKHGRVAYVGAGDNRLPAVHVSDAVRAFRLALERGRAGARYHAVDEEGVPMRDIAAAIGAGLGVPVESISPGEAAEYFGPLAPLAALDLAASGARTREELAWTPTGPALLADLHAATL